MKHRIQDTSLEAFDAFKPKAKDMGRRIVSYLESCGAEGATDEEMDIAFDTVATRSNRPTRNALTKRKVLANSGNRRKTRSGREAIVWVLQQYVEGDPADHASERADLLKKARHKLKGMTDDELGVFVGEGGGDSELLDVFSLFGEVL
jgi:hypothetical protein